MKYIALICFSLSLFTATPSQSHDQWDWIMDNSLENPVTGQWCCGKSDCFKLEVEDVIRMNKKEYRFRLNGKVYKFPSNQVLPTRDHHGKPWACFNLGTGLPRCLFVYFGN